MKETPILFSTPMVQAILDGHKSMTRRICKDANDYCEPLNSFIDNEKRTYAVQNYGDLAHTDYVSLCEVKMPICVGDRLWVKETWWADHERWQDAGTFLYKADAPFPKEWTPAEEFKWRSSRFMPKAAARIWLEVTDVRVERLHEITLEDIEREGIYCDPPYTKEHYAYAPGMRLHWANLWDSINIKRGYGWWDTNPWLWVVSFRRVQP